MTDPISQLFLKAILCADDVIKFADQATSFQKDCADMKRKAERLGPLLKQAARCHFYEQPTQRIMDDTVQGLEKSRTLVCKCRANRLRSYFTIINVAEFKKVQRQLENSIGDLSWLIRVLTPVDEHDEEHLGLPPIAANEPILCLIWEQIAILRWGSIDQRTAAAASLALLARSNDHYRSLIVEEGGVLPLLKLAKEGRMEAQVNAARAIGLIGRDAESVEHIVNAGVCQVFAKILREGHMNVQIVVAWAASELADHHPKCQDP